jgi:precorrin-3B synthase
VSASAALRRGWCPGALRPMASGDGLIVRLRLVGGALTPALARAIAEAAAQFGNGHIDLTARANLQIRGVTERTVPDLQDALEALGVIDADADAEAVRNIVASPLAGFDPNALLDIQPLVATLDQRLRQDRTLWRLPGKFGFVVDDGGRLPVADEPADVAFIAERIDREVRFSLRLAGRLAGHCAVAEATETAARLASAFLDLRGAGETAARRMAALVARIGVAPVLRHAGLASCFEYRAKANAQCRPEARRLGVHDLGGRCALGVGAPFGRLNAQKLVSLADAAERADGELRLTPWRAVLVIGENVDAALATRLPEAGFVLDDDDPIRAVAACPGAPACANASTATHDDARRVAALARRLATAGVAMHVSGCAKGCAHAAAAPVVAVGRDGGYDLALDGRAGDAPMLRGLAARELDPILEKLAKTPRADRAATLRAFARTPT